VWLLRIPALRTYAAHECAIHKVDAFQPYRATRVFDTNAIKDDTSQLKAVKTNRARSGDAEIWVPAVKTLFVVESLINKGLVRCFRQLSADRGIGDSRECGRHESLYPVGA